MEKENNIAKNFKQDDLMNDVMKLKLIEYKKAQDSAEHHDYLSWVVSSIILMASLTLFGFIITIFKTSNLYLLSVGCFLGIFLIIINGCLFFGAQNIKESKYKICKGIETKINEELKDKFKINYQLKNHLSTIKLPHVAKYLYLFLLIIIILAFLTLFHLKLFFG